MYLIRTVSFTAYCRETNIYGRVDTTQASSETTHQYIFIILHLTGHLAVFCQVYIFGNSFRGNANNSHFESFFPGIPPAGGVPHKLLERP